MFPYRPDVLSDLADELEEWRRRLDAKGPLPRTWGGRLRRDLEAEAVAASTIMEGVPVTVDEVRRILAGDEPGEVLPENRRLVEGYREAMSFVLRRADDPNFRWDRELFVSIHDRVLGGRHGAGAGRFRTGQRYVVNALTGEQVFLPPPPDQVATLVDAACQHMEDSRDVSPIDAGWIHVVTAAIHPFADGNGWVARILASLAMYRGGFQRPEFTSLEEWWGRHVDDYYRSFRSLGREFDPGADVTEFVERHLSAQLSQVRALDLRERAERQLWIAMEDLMADLGLQRRVANAVWDAFFGREVTAGYYRSLTDVSPATATNDLVAATAAGLLEARGERRGRRYLPGQRLVFALGDRLGVEIPQEHGAPRQMLVRAVTDRLIEAREVPAADRAL